MDGDVEREERKPFEGMREYAESTMQELLAIYGLAGGELAKSVSRQLPPTFLNPATGQLPHGESSQTFELSRRFSVDKINDSLDHTDSNFVNAFFRGRLCGDVWSILCRI